MKNIQIEAKPFFDMLKEKESSMWDVFAQLINGEEQLIIFLNDDKTVLFDYVLPKDEATLKIQQKQFAADFKKRMMSLYN